MKTIKTIVLTGGPCGGKTSSLAKAYQQLTNLGWTVFSVPEAATELMNSGLKIGKNITPMNFQRAVIQKQLDNENLFQKIASYTPNDKVVIILDRGIIDDKVYVSNEDFKLLLNEFNLTEIDLKTRYSGVIHLVTAANGAAHAYTLENNVARSESKEAAIALDNKGLVAWAGVRNFKIIGNTTTFDEKIDRAVNEMYSIVGLPSQIQIERKFLVDKISINELLKNTEVQELDMSLCYISDNGDKTERKISKVTLDDRSAYFLSEKRRFPNDEVATLEKKLTKPEYIAYSTFALKDRSPINKKRYCFAYKNQYFYLDVFDFESDKCLLEMNLTQKDIPFELPAFLNVNCEVTGNSNYTNYYISKNLHL